MILCSFENEVPSCSQALYAYFAKMKKQKKEKKKKKQLKIREKSTILAMQFNNKFTFFQ